jgi:hypothetical protein
VTLVNIYYVSGPGKSLSKVFGNIPSIVLRSNRYNMAMWIRHCWKGGASDKIRI